ncbi:tigger transposable element-derived protein 6-like [Ornithodoros turicata]|uniref:tigger transposable element-derived protein 6-like n=1 Tax=Ornithodoros turicata TaxID=34597 RepID=UPI0031387D88
MASASSGSQLKRKAISLETKHSILDNHRSGIPVKTLVTKYGLSQPTVSTIIRNRDKIVASATLDGASGKRKRMRGAALPDVEAALYKWFLEVRGRNIPVSGAVLTAKAKQLAFLMEHEGFSPGNAPAVTHTCIEERDAGGKHSKVRVTVLLCCNMDGSDRQKLFVIGKSAKPRDFRSLYSLPVRYRSNSKAWMTKVLFAEWLVELDQEMARKGRKILLLLDNCSAHRVNPRLSNVELLFLPPNSTSKTQPLDMGIIATSGE